MWSSLVNEQKLCLHNQNSRSSSIFNPALFASWQYSSYLSLQHILMCYGHLLSGIVSCFCLIVTLFPCNNFKLIVVKGPKEIWGNIEQIVKKSGAGLWFWAIYRLVDLPIVECWLTACDAHTGTRTTLTTWVTWHKQQCQLVLEPIEKDSLWNARRTKLQGLTAATDFSLATWVKLEKTEWG